MAAEPSAPRAAGALGRIPVRGALLDVSATLGQAVDAVRAGAPLLVLTGAGGRLESVVDPLAVRVASVSGEAAETPIAGLGRTPGFERAAAHDPPPAGGARDPGPVVAARPVVDEAGRPVALEVRRAAPIEHAIVMAGGRGTRLRPLTENVPKPLLEVTGASLLERTLLHLESHGVSASLVSVNYLAEQVEEFVRAGGRWSHSVDCLREREPLGTAGAIGLVDGRFDGPFFLVNGDIATDADLSALAGHHLASGAAVTVATVPYRWRIPYGVVEPDGPRLAGVREKPLYRFETNAGIYAFDPRVAADLPAGRPCDMVELINGLARRGEVVGRFPLVEYWSDVGRPEDFARVQDEVPPLA